MHREIQVLLLTHGDLGKELIRTAALFVPMTSSPMFFKLHEQDKFSDYQKRIETLINDEQDLLILTDMLSGATTRAAALALRHVHVEIVSGVNLMMVITAMREKNTHELCELAKLVQSCGKEDIIDIRKRLMEEE